MVLRTDRPIAEAIRPRTQRFSSIEPFIIWVVLRDSLLNSSNGPRYRKIVMWSVPWFASADRPT